MGVPSTWRKATWVRDYRWGNNKCERTYDCRLPEWTQLNRKIAALSGGLHSGGNILGKCTVCRLHVYEPVQNGTPAAQGIASHAAGHRV